MPTHEPAPVIELLGIDDPRRPSALRLIFSGHASGAADADAEVRRFTQTAELQGLDSSLLAAAFQGSKPAASGLAVKSPGRTAGIHLGLATDPGPAPTWAHQASVCLLRAIQHHAWTRDLAVLQGLLAEGEQPLEGAFVEASFRRLAELVYLERPSTSVAAGPCQGPDLHWTTYGPATHDYFTRILELTYAETLDCPALTGVRTTEEVLAGHRATGVHDPALWFVAQCDEEPAGVILLAPLGVGKLVEVVYMGVTSRFRGRGIGDALMRRACKETGRRRLQGLTLAVDAANAPARAVYQRWGFTEFARRTAWFCVNPG